MAYIEREAVLKIIDNYLKTVNADGKAIIEAVRDIVDIICPDADVVEVVRCKDCAIPHNKWLGCPKMNGLIPPPHHFCSYGERKDRE